MKILITIALALITQMYWGQSRTKNALPPQDSYQALSSRKETMIEKEIINTGTFKDLTLQKIVLRDLTASSEKTFFGIMLLQETFDHISKRTFTFEKEELQSIIKVLEEFEKNAGRKSENQVQRKYTTKNSVELGSTYDPEGETSSHYIKLPVQLYQNVSIINFNSREIKDFIALLRKTESAL